MRHLPTSTTIKYIIMKDLYLMAIAKVEAVLGYLPVKSLKNVKNVQFLNIFLFFYLQEKVLRHLSETTSTHLPN